MRQKITQRGRHEKSLSFPATARHNEDQTNQATRNLFVYLGPIRLKKNKPGTQIESPDTSLAHPRKEEITDMDI